MAYIHIMTQDYMRILALLEDKKVKAIHDFNLPISHSNRINRDTLEAITKAIDACASKISATFVNDDGCDYDTLQEALSELLSTRSKRSANVNLYAYMNSKQRDIIKSTILSIKSMVSSYIRSTYGST